MRTLKRELFPLVFLLSALVASAIVSGCGGGTDVVAGGTPEERFQAGMTALQDEDYQKAQELFNLIITQSPASEYADDAYYYLAESYFRDESYSLAAFNYNRLRQQYPSSPFYRLALFRAAESYDQSSRPADRDQSETRYAIDQYRSFLQLYPQDSLASEAQQRVIQLRTKLAKKDYQTAQQYWGLDDTKAALIYYDKVMDAYPDTDYYDLATIGRIRALTKLNRDQEALETINRFESEHPTSPQLSTIRSLRSDLHQ